MKRMLRDEGKQTDKRFGAPEASVEQRLEAQPSPSRTASLPLGCGEVYNNLDVEVSERLAKLVRSASKPVDSKELAEAFGNEAGRLSRNLGEVAKLDSLAEVCQEFGDARVEDSDGPNIRTIGP